MTNQTNTILHRWFEEVWNKGRKEAIDEMLDPDMVAHGLVDQNGNPINGTAAFKVFFLNFYGAFPDINVVVEDTVSEVDKLVARCKVKATHTGGSFGFSATGKPVEFSGMLQVRLKDGKISEVWHNFDFLTMFQQMGVLNFVGK